MKIAFTLCSNNYLAQAKTLGDSLIKHNPDYRFVIGLVDKFNPEIDYAFFDPYDIITVEGINIPDFNGLVEKYNIIELNTAVKPFLFSHLLDKHANCGTIIYFDPDILILSKFDYIEQKLEGHNIIITPHILSPIGIDSLSGGENLFLKHGLYNLGFIGLSRTAESTNFLSWWKERTYHLGFDKVGEGFFVDQKWIDLVPLFFKKVCIAEHLGLNVAFWNLHEREIDQRDGKFFINQEFDLVFYHFSQYNPNKDALAPHHNRYNFDNRWDTIGLFNIYKELLLSNKYNYFKSFVCDYVVAYNHIKAKNFMEYVKQQERRLRFSWFFKLMRNFLSVSKALALKTYIDYFINIKAIQKTVKGG